MCSKHGRRHKLPNLLIQLYVKESKHSALDHSGPTMDAIGLAVSIASLGTQACQGLISYCNDIKGRDADVASA